jgi:trans-2,3-dihydro-3-hydroxyanthranilate isomerase
MPEARYLITDVFTEAPFGGNQLAVFPDAAGLEGPQMQVLARELNLAESTFVTPGSAPGKFRVRIFTPGAELPFAGHPTVGTAVALAHLGRTEGRDEIVLEEGVGPIRVALRNGGATFFVEGAPERRPHDVAAADIAGMIGVDALAGEAWQAGFGLPFLFIPVRDVAAVAASGLRLERWNAVKSRFWGRGVYVHAVSGDAVHARMFAPGLGVSEDPATGSAAAALAGSVAAPATGSVRRLTIRQGVEMGRPSTIETTTTFAGGSVTGVSVGGGAVVVGEGRFDRLP